MVGNAIGQHAGSTLPWECDWKCLPLWEALSPSPEQSFFGLKPTGILIEIYSSDYSVLPFDPAGTVDPMHLDSRLHTTYVYVRKMTYGKKERLMGSWFHLQCGVDHSTGNKNINEYSFTAKHDFTPV